MQLVYKIKYNEINTAQNFFFPRVQYKISVHAHWEIELISLQFLLVLAVPAILGFSYTQILLFTTYIFDYMWYKVPSFQGPHPLLHCLQYRKPREILHATYSHVPWSIWPRFSKWQYFEVCLSGYKFQCLVCMAATCRSSPFLFCQCSGIS